MPRRWRISAGTDICPCAVSLDLAIVILLHYPGNEAISSAWERPLTIVRNCPIERQGGADLSAIPALDARRGRQRDCLSPASCPRRWRIGFDARPGLLWLNEIQVSGTPRGSAVAAGRLDAFERTTPGMDRRRSHDRWPALHAGERNVQSAGASMNDVYRCTIALTDMTNWDAFNTVYVKYFKPDHFPVRMSFGVTSLGGAAVEVHCEASLQK